MRILFALAVLLCACDPAPAPASPPAGRPSAARTRTGAGDSPRGPSTPEERAAAVEAARRLEAEPLAPGADEERGRLTVWIMQIPDILVKSCNALIGEVEEGPTRSVLFGQMLIGSTVFIIQHPDKAKDDVAVFHAGLESALRAYAVMVKEDPGVRTTFLDDLASRQRAGTLAAFVRETAKDCSG